MLRLAKIVVAEPTLDKARRLAHQRDALFEVVNKGDVAIFVGAVDKGEFDGGAAVAAVEEDMEHAVAREGGHERAVQLVAVDLAIGFEIDLLIEVGNVRMGWAL